VPMAEVEIKKEYRGLGEIAVRLGKGKDFVRKLIKRKQDRLPAKSVGREYWITEEKIQQWLNS
ncbi:MAG: hypothetical protein WC419_06310, partial [Candidatus Omnitrophota bacterium]